MQHPPFLTIIKLNKMKPDVMSREDIDKIVDVFYKKVDKDELLGPFFRDVIPVNWESHVPFMCSFWENVLFYTGDYEGDPLQTHRVISKKQKISSRHFKHWLKLFNETVDELYEGENSEKMKVHAVAIASVMQKKQ